MLDEIEPGWKGLVLLEGDAGDTDIVLGEKSLIKGSRRNDRDDDRLIDRSPDEIWRERCVKKNPDQTTLKNAGVSARIDSKEREMKPLTRLVS